MQWLIFGFYLLFFSFVITRISFFKKSGLSNAWLVLLFALKVLAGLAYAWFYLQPQYLQGSDTWHFFNESCRETDWLLKNPFGFTKDLFSYGYSQSGNLFLGQNSYWNDLKSNVIIKLLAVCNVFTFKSYYADIIFFNFFFFFGMMAFYRLMLILFSERKWWLLISLFCIPSFLFWCSGVHKDGLLFSAIGLVFYSWYCCLQYSFTFKRILIIFLCMLVIFALRNYVCFALIPTLVAWYFSQTKNFKYSITPFFIVYLVGVVLFFATAFISPKINLLQFIVSRQEEFINLNGGSEITTVRLLPTVSSFMKHLPTAIDMAWFRPHLSEFKSNSYLPAIAEILLLSLVTIAFVVLYPKTRKIHPAVWACWFLGISLLLVAGYTITFSGAIVRYRSLILPLLFCPLAGLFTFDKQGIKQ